MNITNEIEKLEEEVEIDSLTSTMLIIIPVVCVLIVLIVVVLIYFLCVRKKRKDHELKKSVSVTNSNLNSKNISKTLSKKFFIKPTLNEKISYKIQQEKKVYSEIKIPADLSQAENVEEQYEMKIKKLKTAVPDDSSSLPSSTRELVGKLEKSKINSHMYVIYSLNFYY